MDAFKSYMEQVKSCVDFRDDPTHTALLVARMRAGDGGAERELIISTLQFTASLATAHCRRMNTLRDLNDLVQEGNKRVSVGIRLFDPVKSSLESFIRFRVKVAFIDYFYGSKAITQTGYRRQMERLIRRARAEISAALGREPTVQELASQLEMDERRVQQYLSQGTISFVGIGAPEDKDGQDGVLKIDPASGEKNPFELAELAEASDLAVKCLGIEDAELLLTYIEHGVPDFQGLYFKYKHKQISVVNARKYKERLVKKLRACLKRMSKLSARGGNHESQRTPNRQVTQRIFNR
jgi:DNA-directed RNA polymerase specialized sigma subunit